MIEAPLPANEVQRLDALNKLRVLDTPIEERFERITRMVCRLLDVPISSFTLVDESRQWFKSVQGISSSETPRGIAFCAHAILGNDVFVIPDAKKDQRFFDNPLVTGAPYIAAYAGYPVRSADGKCIGTICAIDRKPREFTPEETSLLRDMASMVESELRLMEISVSHKQLIKDLSTADRKALVDELTRVWNRRGITQVLDREWKEAAARGATIGLISADIDHFKLVNDTYGHPVGDEVIREVAKRAMSALRNDDTFGRMGGEEFLAILPGCLTDKLGVISERILETVRSRPIRLENGTEIPLTMSIGAAFADPAKVTDPATTISAADEALYRAKLGGRNRYELQLKEVL